MKFVSSGFLIDACGQTVKTVVSVEGGEDIQTIFPKNMSALEILIMVLGLESFFDAIDKDQNIPIQIMENVPETFEVTSDVLVGKVRWIRTKINRGKIERRPSRSF